MTSVCRVLSVYILPTVGPSCIASSVATIGIANTLTTANALLNRVLAGTGQRRDLPGTWRGDGPIAIVRDVAHHHVLRAGRPTFIFDRVCVDHCQHDRLHTMTWGSRFLSSERRVVILPRKSTDDIRCMYHVILSVSISSAVSLPSVMCFRIK